MSELLLENIEEELFNLGLDQKREYDEYQDHNYLRVFCGEHHIDLSPLWSSPTSGDDDEYFFDDDDIHAVLYSYGEVDAEVELFADSESELVAIINRIFSEGVDFLHDLG